MTKDLDFLAKSSLNNYFCDFAVRDPFLTSLTKDFPQKTAKIAHNISKQLQKRIQACQELLLEEVLNEKINRGKLLPGQQVNMRFPQ